jgi:hypothetical protein
MEVSVTSEFPVPANNAAPDKNGNVATYATLNMWVDFHGTGFEQVIKDNQIQSAYLVPGENPWITFGQGLTRQTIDLLVPGDAKLGLTMTRFRISGPGETGLAYDGILGGTLQSGSTPRAGEVPFGEVEDYQINVRQSPYCFGDAPDADFFYPSGGNQKYTTHYDTKLAEDGPRNRYDYRLHLGPFAQYGDDATINPYNPGPSDPSHDGITFTTYGGTPTNFILRAGAQNQMQVNFQNSLTVGTSAYFSAWIDYNFDGTFEPNEEVVTDQPV